MIKEQKYSKVNIHIPNEKGDGVVEIHTITVPVYLDSITNEEMLTEEAIKMIEETKLYYFKKYGLVRK